MKGGSSKLKAHIQDKSAKWAEGCWAGEVESGCLFLLRSWKHWVWKMALGHSNIYLLVWFTRVMKNRKVKWRFQRFQFSILRGFPKQQDSPHVVHFQLVPYCNTGTRQGKTLSEHGAPVLPLPSFPVPQQKPLHWLQGGPTCGGQVSSHILPASPSVCVMGGVCDHVPFSAGGRDSQEQAWPKSWFFPSPCG